MGYIQVIYHTNSLCSIDFVNSYVTYNLPSPCPNGMMGKRLFHRL